MPLLDELLRLAVRRSDENASDEKLPTHRLNRQICVVLFGNDSADLGSSLFARSAIVREIEIARSPDEAVQRTVTFTRNLLGD